MPFSTIPFPVRIILKPIFTFWNMCIADRRVLMIIKNSQASFIIFLSNRIHTHIVGIEYKAFSSSLWVQWGFPGSSDGKAFACYAGDPDSVSGSGSPPGEGNGNPPQYSCLENSMDRRAWWTAVHGVEKIWTQLSNFHFLTFVHDYWKSHNWLYGSLSAKVMSLLSKLA